MSNITTEDPVNEVKLEATLTYKFGDRIHNDNGNGALVFKGLFNGTIPIALKLYATEVKTHFKELKKDLDVLASPDNRHPHFIRYYGSTEDKTFR